MEIRAAEPQGQVWKGRNFLQHGDEDTPGRQKRRVPTEAYFWSSKQSPYEFCFVKLNFIRSSGVSTAEQSILVKTLEHGEKEGGGRERRTKQRETISLTDKNPIPAPSAGRSAWARLQVEEEAVRQAGGKRNHGGRLQGGSLS